jgi:hypothetical protein
MGFKSKKRETGRTRTFIVNEVWHCSYRIDNALGCQHDARELLFESYGLQVTLLQQGKLEKQLVWCGVLQVVHALCYDMI